MLNNIVFLIFTYLFASIPFGLLIGKIFYGIDVRKAGSGNIGATNVLRLCGKIAGISTFLLDGIKGALPVFLYKSIYINDFFYIVGLVAILGHTFPIYLKFKGGKGVATTILIIFAINIKLGFIAFIIFAIFLLLFGFVSLASISMVLFLLPFSMLFGGLNMVLFNSFFLFLILFKHLENIKKLLNKTESKMFNKSIF
jgi:glycerol-3-phosphate acyltransferase PlsY